MTMLHVIDLAVIDAIFTSCEHKLSATSRAIYVNCLTFQFRNLPNMESASVAFTIGYSNVNHTKFKAQFDELAKNKLITYHTEFIRFENVWAKHIDKKRYLITNYFETLSIDEIERQILANTSTIELLAMRHRTTIEHITQELKLFILEKKVQLEQYDNISSAIRHFSNWVGKRISLDPKSAKKIVSHSQILGNE